MHPMRKRRGKATAVLIPASDSDALADRHKRFIGGLVDDHQERLRRAEQAFWTIPPDNATEAELRAAVWDICMGKCAYCGEQMNPFRDFTIDHIHPRCQGGQDALDNYVGCCRSCNSSKGGRRPDEWRH